MTRIRAVTFDFWDTLVHAPTAAETRAARRDRVLTIIREVRRSVTGDELDRVLADIRRRFDEKWTANEQFTGFEATALLVEELELDLDAATRSRLDHAFMGVEPETVPALTPNVETTIRVLKAHGVRIGIICDVGLSPSFVLRSHLEHHGVLELFDHWSFSDEVGVYKPDPRIFEHALAGLGSVAPDEAAHVGDLRRTDVAGARAFGMTAVRYTGSNDDVEQPGEGDRSTLVSDDEAPEGHHVIADHAELLTILGFA